MDIKLAFLIFLCLASVSLSKPSSSSSTLKVTLYFEGLCPACHQLITCQIYPAYKKIGHALKLDLVPFGWSESHKNSDGSIEWECQHGEDECYLNRINACVFHQEKSQDKIMKFLNCQSLAVEDYYDSAEEVVKTCAKEAGISLKQAKQCYDNDKADKYLLEYEERQNNLNPQLEGVPTVWFNDRYDKDLDDEVFEDFLGAACSLLNPKPSGCDE